MSEPTGSQDDFATRAAEGARPTLAREIVEFLRDNKKWWLGPIFVVLALVALLALLGGGASAPFIYTLF